LHVLYARHLVRRGLFAQAEARLHSAVELIGDVRSGTLATHPDDVIFGFVELYEAWGKQDRAAEFRRLRADALARRPAAV
jgi:hypothetical protein